MTEPPRNKPITLEKRKSLLYGASQKRRSVGTIVWWSLAALMIGLVIAYLLRATIGFDLGQLPV